jgi:hypothetical protein
MNIKKLSFLMISTFLAVPNLYATGIFQDLNRYADLPTPKASFQVTYKPTDKLTPKQEAMIDKSWHIDKSSHKEEVSYFAIAEGAFVINKSFSSLKKSLGLTSTKKILNMDDLRRDPKNSNLIQGKKRISKLIFSLEWTFNLKGFSNHLPEDPKEGQNTYVSLLPYTAAHVIEALPAPRYLSYSMSKFNNTFYRWHQVYHFYDLAENKTLITAFSLAQISKTGNDSASEYVNLESEIKKSMNKEWDTLQENASLFFEP